MKNKCCYVIWEGEGAASWHLQCGGKFDDIPAAQKSIDHNNNLGEGKLRNTGKPVIVEEIGEEIGEEIKIPKKILACRNLQLEDIVSVLFGTLEECEMNNRGKCDYDDKPCKVTWYKLVKEESDER